MRTYLIVLMVILGLALNLTACAPSANPPEVTPPESPSPRSSPS